MSDTGRIYAEGHGGQISFDGEEIVVTRKGLLGAIGHMGKSSKYDTSQVIRVEVVEPTALANGTIRFVTPETLAAGTGQVFFTRAQNEAMQVLRKSVEAQIESRSEADRASLELESAQKAEAAAQKARSQAIASYGDHRVAGGYYHFKAPKSFIASKKDIEGAVATFESGADQSRPTLTRIGAGAIIAGPAGAIVGGMFRKNKKKCYVTVVFTDGDTAILEGPVKDETKMRQFAAAVNKIAA